MATVPNYCTREQVKRRLDAKETARNDVEVDEAIATASRLLDGHVPGAGLLHRRFYPEITTRYKDWPPRQTSASYRLWLDADELISVTTLTAGGETIAAADYNLEPANAGPPYTYVEIDLSSSAAFAAGDTSQRAIAITGTFGYRADTKPAGALAEALDDSETGVDVTDSSVIGVGDIAICGTEYMIVTGKGMLDTGQDVAGAALTASASNVTIGVASGAALHVGEVILIDAERMLVVDIAGNTLVVKRSWDGSTLAAHDIGASLYALRTLTVERGSLGSTAAAHDNATALTRHVVPAPVNTLAIAEAMNILLGEESGWARTVGSGENEREASGKGLAALRQQAVEACGRRMRIGVV